MIAQAEISQWLGQVADFLPFGYAFGAGMVSAVNPCGFAMLPVYLTLYLGAEANDFHDRSRFYRLVKGLGIGLTVTAGFGLLFGVVGTIVSAGGTVLMAAMPWLSLVVGSLLLLLGIWILLGNSFSVEFFMRAAAKIGDPREMSVKGFFLFGVAFGATSLSCTLPIFLLVVGGSVSTGDFYTGMLQFFSYILGMGSVMLTLTLGIALVREGVVVGTLRRAMPYVQKLSAILLVASGAYIVYYWLSSGLLFV